MNGTGGVRPDQGSSDEGRPDESPEHGGHVPLDTAGDSGPYTSRLTITLDDGRQLSAAEIEEFRHSQRVAPAAADVELRFPSDRIVGVLDWNGSWDVERGLVLATGVVRVPGGGTVTLRTSAITEVATSGDGWTIVQEPADRRDVDLTFLTQLPPNVIDTLKVSAVDAASFAAVRQLAPGLKRLTLAWSGLGDEVLPHIAALSELTWLQTFGNRFTDAGVQQLAALTNLRSLYLEAETLTAAAFSFAAQLPMLERIGLQDVPVTAGDLAALRRALPGVDVG